MLQIVLLILVTTSFICFGRLDIIGRKVCYNSSISICVRRYNTRMYETHSIVKAIFVNVKDVTLVI